VSAVRTAAIALALVLALAGLRSAMQPRATAVRFVPALAALPEPGDIVARVGSAGVAFEELDAAAQGALATAFGELDRTALEVLARRCRRIAEESMAAAAGLSRQAWLARLWEQSRPDAGALASVAASNREALGASQPDSELLVHLLTLREFRRKLGAALPVLEMEAVDLFRRCRQSPKATVAVCAGRNVLGEELLSWGVEELVRKRRLANEKICSALAGAAGDRLLLETEASASGISVEELLGEAERWAPEPSFDEIHEMAENRLGTLDEATWEEARQKLLQRNRRRQRDELLAALRARYRPHCGVVVAGAPARRAAGGVEYFGAVGCSLCTPGYALLERLRGRFEPDGVSFTWRHHVDPDFAPQFLDAVAIDCAASQGKLWDYLDARVGLSLARSDAAGEAGLDPEAFASCRLDALSAVAVLDAVDAADGLGLRGAVPSWRIGEATLRGWRSEEELAGFIEDSDAAGTAQVP
jgi:hypothetical protein